MSPFVLALAASGTFLAIIAYFWWRGTVNVGEAHRRVRGGALLIDVDSPDVFASAHLDGSVNIPVTDMARRQADIGPIDRAIVVYARSGFTSARAAHLLRTIGYHSVLNVGPMKRWSA
ncbi:MAG: rhodanese-like domain-containing protein [Polyangiaceae bacterium]